VWFLPTPSLVFSLSPSSSLPSFLLSSLLSFLSVLFGVSKSTQPQFIENRYWLSESILQPRFLRVKEGILGFFFASSHFKKEESGLEKKPVMNKTSGIGFRRCFGI
jgi:hypothetical protein